MGGIVKFHCNKGEGGGIKAQWSRKAFLSEMKRKKEKLKLEESALVKETGSVYSNCFD